MHKNVKSALAKTMVAVLAISMFGIQAPASSAAKKPKLSTQKVALTVKKSKKVTIKNVKAKKVKKLTVKSSKKKVATVKKNGKTAFTITGKKAGTATVTAKITLKGQKKATSLKVKVTVKAAPQPTKAPNPTVAPSTSPAVSPSAAPSVAPSAVPSAAPSATPDNGPKPDYTAAPNPGVKRITHTSNIKNPVISNITIWGLRDNPYAETGYDYNQYGPFSGLFTKWYEPKDSFKAVHELFTADTAQSLNSMKLMEATEENEEPSATPDAVGTVSDESVKTTLTYITGPDDNQTKTTYTIDAINRTSAANEEQRVTLVDGETLATTGTTDNPAVLVSGRSSNWHGIAFDITDFVSDPTKDYKLSMEIYHTASAHNSDPFYTQIGLLDAEGNEDANERPMLVMQSAKANTWTRYSANFSINGYNFPRFIMYANWYGNTTTHDDFYVRNVTVQEIYSDKAYDTSETLSYSPLYENTEKNYGFSFGAVIGNAAFKDSNYTDVLSKHFSSLTVDNDLKMYSLLDQDATVANANGDGMPVLRKDGTGEAMVKWAYENGIGVRGHTIVCDTAMSTNCKYFFHEDYDTSKPLASKEVMLERLRSFITQTIMYFEEKYPGTIHTWDVVNEAIATGSGDYTTGDARQIQITDNMFYDTIGDDYVEYSFLYAREAVNNLKELYPDRDINIKLFYNDFNCFEYKKRNAICALAESIQAFGQEQGMGNLIDGVGMQCYLGTTGKGASELSDALLQTSTKKTASSIPNAVFKFHDLGLDVQFTELTIRNYVESENSIQADYYTKFMQMAIDINNGTMQKVLE